MYQNISEFKIGLSGIGKAFFMQKGWVLVFLFIVGGCASYRPMPITSESIQERLSSPDMNEIRIQTENFKHPCIKTIPFDDRNGLSPDEAAILAVIANPELRAIRDRRGIALAQLMQSGILPNPQLSYNFGIPVGGNTKGKINSFGLGLGWDITSVIARNANIDVAKANSGAIDLDIAWQEWQVAEAARLHTYRLIIARQQLAIAKQGVKFFRQLQKNIKQGIAFGVKTELDLLLANTSLQKANSRMLNTELMIEQERLAFNRTLGFPPEIKVSIETNIVWHLEQIPPAKTLFENAITKRLDLRALRLGYKSREARVRSAIWSQFPKINIGLIGERDTDSIKTVGAGVNIDIPFFDRNQGRIAEERASRRQLFDEYTARLFATRADINRLSTILKNTQQQLAVIDKSLSERETLIKDFNNATNDGLTDIFSYDTAMSSMYRQQIKRIELEQKIINVGIALEIASGHYGLIFENKIEMENSQ